MPKPALTILYWEWSFVTKAISKPHWKLKCTIPSCTYFLPSPFLASRMHQRCNYLLLKAFLLISLQKILSLCCLWRDLVVMMCWLLMNSTTLFQINPGFCCSFRGFEKSLYFLQQYVNVFKQVLSDECSKITPHTHKSNDAYMYQKYH